jgi:hypothetical protein
VTVAIPPVWGGCRPTKRMRIRHVGDWVFKGWGRKLGKPKDVKFNSRGSPLQFKLEIIRFKYHYLLI